ncbi:hypothetical protein [Xenorhabdus lircayensis]|uniref:Type III secretion system effector and immunogenic protein OspC2 n=1 Tax=Xenorhabdus lircayensis TaxID=2763499 RepID=A0ABS0U4T1_9GAMM|nr:hypothetical protein [Xenorhabdus lircayensis]MBI6547770.1 hypothetical protein [Xenorhabdus lircayensis]
MNEKDAWDKFRRATRQCWASRAIDRMSKTMTERAEEGVSKIIYDFNKTECYDDSPNLHFNMRTITDDLRNSLGKFTNEELEFAKSFKSKEFYIVHVSDKYLIDNLNNSKKDLNLYSRVRLEEKKISFNKYNSSVKDISRLGNDDYVFFSLEVGIIPKKTKSVFGNYFYRIRYSGDNISLMHSSMVLFDNLMPKKHLGQPFCCKRLFERLKISDSSKAQFRARKLCRGKSSFSGFYHSLNGLLYSIIHVIRELENEDDKKELLSARSDEEINLIINGLFRPEVRVPRMIGFVEGSYQVTKYNLS